MENKVNPDQDPQAVLRSQEAALKTAAANYNGELVFGRVPQGYNTNINVRVVAIRDLDLFPVTLGCQPRGGGKSNPLTNVGTLLPVELIGKLKEADKTFVQWLAQDEANTKLFLEQPLEALNKAGIEFTRAEQKALARTQTETENSRLVAPGVKITQLSVTAHPNGRIGEIKPGSGGSGGSGTGTRVKGGGNAGDVIKGGGDCGCGKPKGKE